HHDLDRSCAGDIALMGDNFATGCLHALNGFRDAVEIAVDAENRRTCRGETHANRAAVAPAGADAACASDDRDAVLQAPAHALSLRSIYAPERTDRSGVCSRPAAPWVRLRGTRSR